jgi:hypothetical protein
MTVITDRLLPSAAMLVGDAVIVVAVALAAPTAAVAVAANTTVW